MPPLPSVPHVVKLQIHWGVEGDVSAMTNHYYDYVGAAPTAAQLATFCANVVSNGQADLAALCSDSVGMLSAEATDLTSSTSAQGSGGVAWVGTRGTALLPPSAAAVVQHVIDRRYRGGKPRTYLPVGVSGDVALTGFWSDLFVTEVDGGWGAFNADNVSVTWGPTLALVSVSYYQGSTVVISPTTGRARNVATRRGAPVVDTVVGHTTDKVIGSQRRRNRDA